MPTDLDPGLVVDEYSCGRTWMISRSTGMATALRRVDRLLRHRGGDLVVGRG